MKMLPDIHDFPVLVEYISLREALITEKNPDKVKKICHRMIGITPEVKKAGDIYNAKLLKERPHDITYDFATVLPFKRLAVIYEKEGDIFRAITICDHALSFGYEDDGTKAGMKGRLEKLMKKAGY